MKQLTDWLRESLDDLKEQCRLLNLSDHGIRPEGGTGLITPTQYGILTSEVVDRLVDYEIVQLWAELERKTRMMTINTDVAVLIDETTSIKRTCFEAERHKKEVWIDYLTRRREDNLADWVKREDKMIERIFAQEEFVKENDITSVEDKDIQRTPGSKPVKIILKFVSPLKAKPAAASDAQRETTQQPIFVAKDLPELPIQMLTPASDEQEGGNHVEPDHVETV